MNAELARQIVEQISYKPGWKLLLKENTRGLYVQMEVTSELDSITRKPCMFRTSKRYISEFMCKQEVVGLVFGLIKDAELHEVHEWFRYKGASIYNPHLDPDALVVIASKKDNFNCRENAMSMEEAA